MANILPSIVRCDRVCVEQDCARITPQTHAAREAHSGGYATAGAEFVGDRFHAALGGTEDVFGNAMGQLEPGVEPGPSIPPAVVFADQASHAARSLPLALPLDALHGSPLFSSSSGALLVSPAARGMASGTDGGICLNSGRITAFRSNAAGMDAVTEARQTPCNKLLLCGYAEAAGNASEPASEPTASRAEDIGCSVPCSPPCVKMGQMAATQPTTDVGSCVAIGVEEAAPAIPRLVHHVATVDDLAANLKKRVAFLEREVSDLKMMQGGNGASSPDASPSRRAFVSLYGAGSRMHMGIFHASNRPSWLQATRHCVWKPWSAWDRSGSELQRIERATHMVLYYHIWWITLPIPWSLLHWHYEGATLQVLPAIALMMMVFVSNNHWRDVCYGGWRHIADAVWVMLVFLAAVSALLSRVPQEDWNLHLECIFTMAAFAQGSFAMAWWRHLRGDVVGGLFWHVVFREFAVGILGYTQVADSSAELLKTLPALESSGVLSKAMVSAWRSTSQFTCGCCFIMVQCALYGISGRVIWILAKRAMVPELMEARGPRQPLLLGEACGGSVKDRSSHRYENGGATPS